MIRELRFLSWDVYIFTINLSSKSMMGDADSNPFRVNMQLDALWLL